MALNFLNKSRVIIFLTLLGMAVFMWFSLHYYYQKREQYVMNKFSEEIVVMQTMNIMNGMKEKELAALPFSQEDAEWLLRQTETIGFQFQYQDTNGNSWSNDYEERGSRKYESPLIAKGQLLGNVTATYQPENIYRQQLYEKPKFAYELMGISIFLLILIYASSSMLSRRTIELSKQAKQISQGYRAEEAHVKGSLELQQISSTLNGLIREINKQESLRQTLMQDVAHEFRTPLTSMLTTIEAMIDGVYPTNEEQLKEIYEEMERLSRLVKDMEQLSEAESSYFSLKIRKHDITKLLKGVYQNFITIAKENDIKLLFEKPHIPVYAEVDNDRVIQMVYNLLSNAIKYSHPEGTVILGLDSTENSIIISCKDSGIGIDRQHLELVFHRLYRVDKSRSRKSGGLGVGLSITKALVEAHKGKIIVESAINEGSTFSILLPKTYQGIQIDRKINEQGG